MNIARAAFPAIALFCFSDFAAGQQSTTPLQNTEKYQCLEACGGANPSPYCLIVPKDKQLGTALSALRKQLSDKNVDRITSVDLMKYFQIDRDPCERGDTVRSNGVWSNKGFACLIEVKIDVFPGTDKVPIRIHIPNDFMFTTTLQSDLVTVSPQVTATLLEIQDSDLHNDWGGVIRAASASMSGAMFQLPRGCIKIPF